MRTLRLARIAAEAEGVRLREQARRTLVRAVLGAIAMIFLLAAVVFGHLAAWYWLRSFWARLDSALAITGADLIIAVLLTVVAALWSPGRLEIEALAVRRQALDGAIGSVAVSALVARLLRQVVGLLARRKETVRR